MNPETGQVTTESPNFVLARTAGIGAGLFFNNAKRIEELRGPLDADDSNTLGNDPV